MLDFTKYCRLIEAVWGDDWEEEKMGTLLPKWPVEERLMRPKSRNSPWVTSADLVPEEALPKWKRAKKHRIIEAVEEDSVQSESQLRGGSVGTPGAEGTVEEEATGVSTATPGNSLSDCTGPSCATLTPPPANREDSILSAHFTPVNRRATFSPSLSHCPSRSQSPLA